VGTGLILCYQDLQESSPTVRPTYRKRRLSGHQLHLAGSLFTVSCDLWGWMKGSWWLRYFIVKFKCIIACQSNIVFSQLLFYYKSFLKCLICSTSTILGTNGLNSADVPFSNIQTNKQICWYLWTTHHFGLKFTQDERSDVLCRINRLPCQALKFNFVVDLLKDMVTDQSNVRHSWQMSFAGVCYPLNPHSSAWAHPAPLTSPCWTRPWRWGNEIVHYHHEYLQ